MYFINIFQWKIFLFCFHMYFQVFLMSQETVHSFATWNSWDIILVLFKCLSALQKSWLLNQFPIKFILHFQDDFGDFKISFSILFYFGFLAWKDMKKNCNCFWSLAKTQQWTHLWQKLTKCSWNAFPHVGCTTEVLSIAPQRRDPELYLESKLSRLVTTVTV